MLTRIHPPSTSQQPQGCSVPRDQPLQHLANRRIAVLMAGALAGVDVPAQPQLQWILASNAFDEVYAVQMPHVYWYGTSASDSTSRSRAYDDVHHDREQVLQNDDDSGTNIVIAIDEALTMIKAALADVIRQPFAKLCIVAYSMSSHATVRLWGDLKAMVAHHHRCRHQVYDSRQQHLVSHPLQCAAAAAAATTACACNKLYAILIGSAVWFAPAHRVLLANYFSATSLRAVGRLERVHPFHGKAMPLILACIRQWLAGNPPTIERTDANGATFTSPIKLAYSSTLYVDHDPTYYERVYRDCNVAFVCGLQDAVMPLSNIWLDRNVPTPTLVVNPYSIRKHLADCGVHDANAEYKHLWAIDSEHVDRIENHQPPRDCARLYLGPGDHFELVGRYQNEIGQCVQHAAQAFMQSDQQRAAQAKL
jgi:hypothetical protein